MALIPIGPWQQDSTYRVHPLGLMDSTYRVPLLDSNYLGYVTRGGTTAFKGAGTPPTRPAHAKPIKVAMED